MKELTIAILKKKAKEFSILVSASPISDLFGITDRKAVGTYIEHKFIEYLSLNYDFEKGSSAKGIDLPGETINADIKVTSIKQPQSSCPFKDAKQKIFGLGYNLALFVYDKNDNQKTKKAELKIVSCTFITKERTADYTTSFRLREMIQDGAIEEDIIAYLHDKNIPADEITLQQIATQILNTPPKQGYLTISNALQWRLQYGRIVSLTKSTQGISKLI